MRARDGMLADRLRERVTLEAETRVSNGQGGWTTTWAQVPGTTTILAELIGLTGDESVAAAIERSVQRWRITIRKRGGVTTRRRLRGLDSGLVYDIKSVSPDPRDPQAGLVLICESGITG